MLLLDEWRKEKFLFDDLLCVSVATKFHAEKQEKKWSPLFQGHLQQIWLSSCNVYIQFVFLEILRQPLNCYSLSLSCLMWPLHVFFTNVCRAQSRKPPERANCPIKLGMSTQDCSFNRRVSRFLGLFSLNLDRNFLNWLFLQPVSCSWSTMPNNIEWSTLHFVCFSVARSRTQRCAHAFGIQTVYVRIYC